MKERLAQAFEKKAWAEVGDWASLTSDKAKKVQTAICRLRNLIADGSICLDAAIGEFIALLAVIKDS